MGTVTGPHARARVKAGLASRVARSWRSEPRSPGRVARRQRRPARQRERAEDQQAQRGDGQVAVDDREAGDGDRPEGRGARGGQRQRDRGAPGREAQRQGDAEQAAGQHRPLRELLEVVDEQAGRLARRAVAVQFTLNQNSTLQ
ncbi:MAG: hypothetical protein HZB46_10635 [Solirubrobacterales bacterium]|nr:hypothetical protein [Solirubrobacterales bacterium]